MLLLNSLFKIGFGLAIGADLADTPTPFSTAAGVSNNLNAEAVRTSTASGTAIGSGSFGSTGAVSSLDAWNTAIGSLSGSDSELNLNSDLPDSDSEKDLDRDEQSLPVMNVMVQVDSKHAATPAAIAGATIGLVTLAVGFAAIFKFKLFLRRRSLRMLYSESSESE